MPVSAVPNIGYWLLGYTATCHTAKLSLLTKECLPRQTLNCTMGAADKSSKRATQLPARYRDGDSSLKRKAAASSEIEQPNDTEAPYGSAPIYHKKQRRRILDSDEEDNEAQVPDVIEVEDDVPQNPSAKSGRNNKDSTVNAKDTQKTLSAGTEEDDEELDADGEEAEAERELGTNI